jgi:hypothetical protein
MKVYIVKDDDLDRLTALLAMDPKHGTTGHSSQALSQEEIEAHNRAYRFFNYQICNWLASIKE